MVFGSYKVTAVKEKEEGSKHVQILVALAVCLPNFIYGAAMGWISPNKELLMSNSSPTGSPLSEEQISWMASVIFIFAPIAVFFYGTAADKFGRKNALLGCSVPILLGWVAKLIYAHPVSYIAGRALIGFGAGGAFVVCPLYLKEISEDSIRGMTGTFITFSQTMGNLLIYVMGDMLPYVAVLWILAILPLIHICIMMRLPETPSYLVRRIEDEKAAKVLAFLRSLPVNNKTIDEEVKNLVIEQVISEPKFSPKALWADKTAVKAFWVTLNVNLAREFCGCIVVLVYASHIFAEAAKVSDGSFSLSPNKQSILLGVVQIVGSFVACQLVDRAGRKPLLAVTSVITGIAMFLLGVWFYLQTIGILLPGWIPVVALCVSIFADSAGLAPLPYVIMTEMFSFQFRGTVATLIMAISFGTDFGLLKVFASLNTWIGFHSTFWIFSIIGLANVVYLILYVPETKMRSLEDIYADLDRRTKRRKAETVVETTHL